MRRVDQVVVVGRDAAAWLTAIALHRAFAGAGLSISVVELPSLLGAADVYSTTPSLAGLHRLLGLSEKEVLRVCRGLPVAGQRFSGWSGEGSAFLHGYDSKRAAINEIDFLQFWVKAREQGMQVALEDFSVAAAAAKQGRLSPKGTDPDMFGNVMPGYHLNARAYAGAMRRFALDQGVGHYPGLLERVERDGDRIRSVALAGGDRVTGDFFIDATGAEASLIGGQPGDAFQSWADWLPCDRILAGSRPSLSPLPAFSEIMAFRSGWIGLFPLQNRTAIAAMFDAGETSEAEALNAIGRLTGMPSQGEAIVRPFGAGARAPWIGNCVALGEAAAVLEPIDAVQLHLVHVGISNLVSLFPVEARDMPEAAAYNETMGRHVANVRDFQVAHYRLNRRFGEALWDRARSAEGPASLDSKLALFSSRAKVLLYDDEFFQEQNWASIFIGHGLMPRGHDPVVDTVPVEEQVEKFQQLLHVIATRVKGMQTVGDYLAAGEQPRRAGLF